MSTPANASLVTTVRGDLCLVLAHLRESDGCLRQVRLTPEDRAVLTAQTQDIHRALDRITLWISAGNLDLDEELASLQQDEA
jgi:hypothetical protein